jgi:3-hydroxyacyl-CoA dehydrogenase
MDVTLVGVGFVGRAWAIAFARAGHTVTLWTRRPEAAEEALAPIRAILPALEKSGQLGGRSIAEMMDLLRVDTDFDRAVGRADWVQESVAEEIGQKSAMFARLDAAARPEAILASSTSALLPSRFTAGLAGGRRCLVAHPINPPFLIPAVEVVPAPWTDPAVVDHAVDLLTGIGQAPIVMRRELAGFVMNRLQGAVLQEAFRLVAGGFASIEDVDRGLRDGLALRWAFVGPFETIDLNAPDGVRQYCERYEGFYADLFESQRERVAWTGPWLADIEAARRAALPAGELENRRLWRDACLADLAALKKALPTA